MRILYVHGYCSAGQSGTSDCLRKLLPEHEIISPDVPVDPLEAMDFLKQLCIDECPHIIIGTSLGGFYAHQLRNYATCVCVNPALRLSTITDILKVGTFEFFHKRKDGMQSFTISEETIEHFRYLEQHQFDGVEESEYTRKRVYGLFGTEDTTVNSKEEFARYYPNVTLFKGEHRMNNKIVKDTIIPLIKFIYEQYSKGEPCLGFFHTAEQANHNFVVGRGTENSKQKRMPYLIPVILDGRYYLYDRKEDKILSKDYERIFRYVGAYVDYYVAVEGSKKGILDSRTGEELTPIEMDEVYQMMDPDAFIPLMKDGKAGAFGRQYVAPIYDKMEICSEEYTKVWLNSKQGWIDNNGKFTTNESEAAYGSWYDYSK